MPPSRGSSQPMTEPASLVSPALQASSFLCIPVISMYCKHFLPGFCSHLLPAHSSPLPNSVSLRREVWWISIFTGASVHPPAQRLVPGSCPLGTAAVSQMPFDTYCRMTFEHWCKHSVYFFPALGTGLLSQFQLPMYLLPAEGWRSATHSWISQWSSVVPYSRAVVLDSGNTEKHRTVLLECQLCEDRHTLLLLSFGLSGSTIPRMVPGTQEMLIRKCILNE